MFQLNNNFVRLSISRKSEAQDGETERQTGCRVQCGFPGKDSVIIDQEFEGYFLSNFSAKMQKKIKLQIRADISFICYLTALHLTQ